MTTAESQAAYDAGNFDAILADECRELLALDDTTLAELGLRRDALLCQLDELDN